MSKRFVRDCVLKVFSTRECGAKRYIYERSGRHSLVNCKNTTDAIQLLHVSVKSLQVESYYLIALCYAGTVSLTTTTLPDKTSCQCAVCNSTTAGLGTGTSIIVAVATFLLGAFVATVVTLIVFR